MSDGEPTLRELWQLKQDYRNAPADDDQAQRDTWQRYHDAESNAGFLKGLAVYQWLTQLAADEVAIRHDLVDLTGFLLGQGCRIGEALAVAWESVDLTRGTVEIDYTLVRVKGKGLVRKRTKTSAGERTAVAWLRRGDPCVPRCGAVRATGRLPAPRGPDGECHGDTAGSSSSVPGLPGRLA